jgi:hypothetical protein
MDLVSSHPLPKDVFVDRCVRSIFLEESEVYICSSITHVFGVYLKELVPDLYFRFAVRHFKKSQKIAQQARTDKNK